MQVIAALSVHAAQHRFRDCPAIHYLYSPVCREHEASSNTNALQPDERAAPRSFCMVKKSTPQPIIIPAAMHLRAAVWHGASSLRATCKRATCYAPSPRPPSSAPRLPLLRTCCARSASAGAWRSLRQSCTSMEQARHPAGACTGGAEAPPYDRACLLLLLLLASRHADPRL